MSNPYPEYKRNTITVPLAEQPAQQEPVTDQAFLGRMLIAMEGVIDVADRKTNEFDVLRACIVDLTLMLHSSQPAQRKPLTDEQSSRWAVFCGICRKQWSVPYQHPGKSVCDDCEAANIIKEQP